MDLDRFVSEQNILHYRRLLALAEDDQQRRIVADLLAEEIARQNGRSDGSDPDARG